MAEGLRVCGPTPASALQLTWIGTLKGVCVKELAMNLFRPLALFSILLASTPSGAAKPGDAQVEEPDKESGDQRLEILEKSNAEALCKVKGKICMRAGAGTAAEGSDAAPAFKRKETNKGDWVVELHGNFKKPAIAGNAQFIF